MIPYTYDTSMNRGTLEYIRRYSNEPNLPQFSHLNVATFDHIVSNGPRDLTRPQPAPLLQPSLLQTQGGQSVQLALTAHSVVLRELFHPEGGPVQLTEEGACVPHVGNVQGPMEEERHDDGGTSHDLSVQHLDLLHLIREPLACISGTHLLWAHQWRARWREREREGERERKGEREREGERERGGEEGRGSGREGSERGREREGSEREREGRE